MISAILSLWSWPFAHMSAGICACVFVCFGYVFHYVDWWLCLVMLFSRADCFELLDAFSCGLCLCMSKCVYICVCLHAVNYVYAHVNACMLVCASVCVVVLCSL